jgi:hypothetical protein
VDVPSTQTITIGNNVAEGVEVSISNTNSAVVLEGLTEWNLAWFMDAHFVFPPASDVTVGGNTFIRVLTEFANGTQIPYAGTATLVTDSSDIITPNLQLTFINGEAAVFAGNEMAEMVTLSVQDDQSTGYSTSETGSLTFIAAIVDSVRTDAATAVAGDGVVVTVTARDQYDNIALFDSGSAFDVAITQAGTEVITVQATLVNGVGSVQSSHSDLNSVGHFEATIVANSASATALPSLTLTASTFEVVHAAHIAFEFSVQETEVGAQAGLLITSRDVYGNPVLSENTAGALSLNGSATSTSLLLNFNSGASNSLIIYNEVAELTAFSYAGVVIGYVTFTPSTTDHYTTSPISDGSVDEVFNLVSYAMDRFNNLNYNDVSTGLAVIGGGTVSSSPTSATLVAGVATFTLSVHIPTTVSVKTRGAV